MAGAEAGWHRLALPWALLAAALLVANPSAAQTFQDRAGTGIKTISVSQLPPPARETLRLLRSNGPFPYVKDGAIFGNREQRLPRRPRGYYREYTVPTPGSHDRGPARIVAGRNGERYYTDDHYRSFKRILQ
jgi:ribonuclease T1